MHKILLPLPANCIQGTFLQRVKRFSVEFEYAGKRLWAHTNNSGSMLGLCRSNSTALFSPAPNPNRKLPYTLELMQVDGTWVGVNTLTPNRLIKAAFKAGALPWAAGYTEFKAEVKYGNSRIDAVLSGCGMPPLWVECKNVSMVEDEVAAFPDAITERGQKHLHEMQELVASGGRAAFFYCIQRTDAKCFAPADYVDAEYARMFYSCLQSSTRNGVEAHPHIVPVSPAGISLGAELQIVPASF